VKKMHQQSAQHRSPPRGLNLLRDPGFGCDGVNLWQTVWFVRQSTPEPEALSWFLCNHAFPSSGFKARMCAMHAK
jgi:hypothetical protein